MSEACTYALRGAIGVDMDSPEVIDTAVSRLFTTLMERNSLTDEDLCFVEFSQTDDLKTRNAAAAVRKAGFCANVPLFCVQEATICGMMPKVIRVLVMVNHPQKSEPHMVYLGSAAKLRTDLKG